MLIGVLVLVLVVIGIVAGYMLLQGPVDLRNFAAEGGACFEEFYPEVKCRVKYKLTKEQGSPPPAQGIAYILNEAGEKVRFDNGTKEQQQIALPPGDHSEDPVELTFNNVSNDMFFADPNNDGVSEAECHIEELVVPDECCKVEDPSGGGSQIASSCTACTDGQTCFDKAYCERNKLDPFCEDEKGCSCKDLFGETDLTDSAATRRNGTIKDNPYGNITIFPEYESGPNDSSFIEAIVAIKNKIMELDLNGDGVNDFKINCINCSSLYSEIETDTKNVFITLTPYVKDRGDGVQACVGLDKDGETERFFNVKGELQEEPDEFYFRFRCNQARNGSGPGAADTSRVTYFNFVNEKPNVRWKCSEEEPTPTIEYTEEVCRWGCEARCPACPRGGQQPMMSGVRGLKDGKWEILENVKCENLEPACNFGFRKFGTTAKQEPPIDFRLGNEGKDHPAPEPARGIDPNGLNNTCYSAGDRIFLDTVSDAGDRINWDYVEFPGGPVAPSSVPTDNGSVSFPYDDPGTYDIALACELDETEREDTYFDELGNSLDLSEYEEVECIKRIVVSCGGGGGGGGNPDPSPEPSPNPSVEPVACYDECEVGTDTCGTAMQCIDHDSNPDTAGRCVMYPENDCDDIEEGPEKEACYCNEPTPTPTGGACRVDVSAQCIPLQ